MRKIVYTVLITVFIVVNILLVGILIVNTGEYVDKINRNEIQVEEENVEENYEEDLDIKEKIKRFIFKSE